MISITDKAKEKLTTLLQSDGRPELGLRVAILGRCSGNFLYSLRLVEEGERESTDIEIDLEGIKTYVEAESAPSMRNARLDFSDTPPRAGFTFDNPNPLWEDPLSEKVQKVIDETVNPGLASHGGFLALVKVADGKAYVRMGGGCHGCAMANVTISEGVETQITSAVPEITAVVDITDHEGGRNPYQQ